MRSYVRIKTEIRGESGIKRKMQPPPAGHLLSERNRRGGGGGVGRRPEAQPSPRPSNKEPGGEAHLPGGLVAGGFWI